MRSSIQRKAFLFLLSALTAVLIGCPPHVRIGDLTSNPGRYVDKEATITGTVTSSFGFFGAGGFQVDDGTVSIWVLSENY